MCSATMALVPVAAVKDVGNLAEPDLTNALRCMKEALDKPEEPAWER